MDNDEVAVAHSELILEGNPMYFRSYDEVLAMFDGFELVAPGVVNAPEWRREPGCADTGPQDVYVGLARKT